MTLPDDGLDLVDGGDAVARLSRLGFINVDRTQLPVRHRIRSRGIPNALQEHPVVQTEDIALASQVTAQLLGSAMITPHPSGSDTFLTTINAVRLVDVTMAYVDFACASTLHVSQAADCYTVHMTTSGLVHVEIDGQRSEITPFFALVVSPRMAYTLECERDSPQLIVRIEKDALERQLSRLLGKTPGDPLRFVPLGDLTSDGALRWHGALQILSSEIVSPASLIQHGVGAPALEELIMSTLLYLQQSNYWMRLRSLPMRSGRPAVRRSMDYIEEHLAEPITLADLERATGMSSRSIQVGFKEDMQTTPIAYIRERRLDKVRQALMAAEPGDGLTVTEAAERWGFSHLGSFSVLYRERYGESPSRTLRRS